MKVHLLQVLVIDHDHLGADEVERVLEDANYPNDCVIPHVVKSQSADVQKWDEDPITWTKDGGFIGSSYTPEVDQLFRQTLRLMKDVPNNEYVLLFGESGYGGTPLRCEVCKFYPDWGGWRTYAGDYFGDTGNSNPVGWLPLPVAR